MLASSIAALPSEWDCSETLVVARETNATEFESLAEFIVTVSRSSVSSHTYNMACIHICNLITVYSLAPLWRLKGSMGHCYLAIRH